MITQNSMKADMLKNADGYDSRIPHIYALTGLSRAGKTSAGRKAALYAGISFYDSDALLHDETKCSPREIYVQQGKDTFYHAEWQTLQHFFVQNQAADCVLALGGGFCDNPYTSDAIYPVRDKIYTIFLDASEEVLFKRLTCEAARCGNYPAFLGSLPADKHSEACRLFSHLYKRRKQTYTAAASYILDVTSLTIEETAIQIAHVIDT
ncbi:MAG: shikimate kinase [Treponema sp.]